MGNLVAAYPICSRAPFLCGEHLAAQARAAMHQGWPVRPWLAVLFSLATVFSCGLVLIALVTLAWRFVGYAARDVAAAERVIAEADVRESLADANVEAAQQLESEARAKHAEVAAQATRWRAKVDALRAEAEGLGQLIEHEKAELERLRKRREAML
ncbi:MAG: hypothetical protein B7X31_12305 [Thiomonas sp. 13-66-29]|nr:MAG: hypothetical protein B7X31_12305 [Thiomonas sp. 13-66-29]